MVLPDFLMRDPDGFIHVTGHRIGLLHLMHYHKEGDSAERLLQRFPTLSLPLIRQVMDFYEKNQKEVDAYLASCLAEMEQQRAAAPPAPTLDELRRRLQTRHGEAS